MAMAIERTPVLTGKAAEEFYERWAKMKGRRSKEEIEESIHAKNGANSR
jgi:hypothetical protein